MSTTNNIITITPKPQHHIVHREEQWMIIDSEIRKRLTEPVLTKSIIAIFGTAGIGKSTFLRETLLSRLQEKYPSLPVAKIDFDKELADQRYDGRLRCNILIDLIAGFEKSSNKSANIDSLKRKWDTAILKSPGKKKLEQIELDLINAFTEYILLLSSKSGNHPVILILDTVEQADRDVVGWLQEKIQAPTTDCGYVLWLVASRQPLECQPFFLRPRYHWLPFEPFKTQQIQSQIPEHPELASAVQKYSFGLPAATTKLVDVILKIEKEQQKTVELPDFEEEQVKEQLILSLEDLLNLKHYFGRLEDHYLSQALEILSPLRLFNVAVVTELLPTKLPDAYKLTDISSDPLYEIQKMVQTRLVSWDRSRRGYVFEEPLRHIVALILRYRKPDMYEAIQEWAADRYLEWAKNVPSKRLDYIVEALYHRLNLLLIEEDADPVSKLVFILEEMIHSMQVKDELIELKEQLEGDRDFVSILKSDGMERLLAPLKM